MAYRVLHQTVVAAALLFCGTAGFAQSPAETMNPAAFVKKAALVNLIELETGKIAEERAASAEVKTFAHRMVTDHTEMQAELIKAAKLTTAALPTETEPAHAARKQQLLAKSGVAFDRAYLDHMTAGHEEAAAFLTQAAAHLVDPALKEWATKAVPLVQEHLGEARRLKERISGR
jgi:putative membrane protein